MPGKPPPGGCGASDRELPIWVVMAAGMLLATGFFIGLALVRGTCVLTGNWAEWG